MLRALYLVAWVWLCPAILAATAGQTAIGNTHYPNGGMLQLAPYTDFGRDDDIREVLVNTSGTLAYVWLGISRAKLVRVDLDAGKKIDELQPVPESFSFTRGAAIDPASRYIYVQVGLGGGGERISKIDANSMSVVASLELGMNESAYALTIDPAGAFLYCGTSDSKIIKISLATFTRVADLLLPASEAIVLFGSVDPAGTFAYFYTSSGEPRLVKIRLSDFTRQGTLVMPSFSDGFASIGFEPSGSYLYVPISNQAPGRLARVDLLNFTTIDFLTLPSGSPAIRGVAVNSQGTRAGLLLSDGGVLPTYLGSLSFNTAIPGPQTGLIWRGSIPVRGGSGRRMLNFLGSSGVIELVDYSTEDRKLIILDTGELFIRNIMVGDDGRYGYFLTAGPLLKILKFDLARGKRHSSNVLSLDRYASAAENNGNTAMLAAGVDDFTELFRLDMGTLGRTGGTIISGLSFLGSLSLSNPNRAVLSGRTTNGGHRLLAYDAATLAQQYSNIYVQSANLAPGQALADPASNNIYFNHAVNRSVQLYNAAANSFLTSIQLPDNPRYLLRNPVTAQLLSITYSPPEPSRIYEFNANLNNTNEVGITTDDADARLITSADVSRDGQFAYYYSYNGKTVYRHHLANFSQMDSYKSTSPNPPSSIKLNANGTVLLLPDGSYQVSRIGLTPRERIAGTKFTLAHRSEIQSVSFYTHAAVGLRRTEISPLPTGRAAMLKEGVIFKAGNRAVFVTEQSPPQLLGINTVTRDVVNTATLTASDGDIDCAAIEPGGTHLYYGTFSTPGKIIKVRTADLARIGELTLQNNESNLRAAAMDPAGEFLYVGCAELPARIVKIRLSDFTRVGALDLLESDGSPRALAIAGNFLYMAGGGSTGQVIRINLTTFTRTGVLTLNAGEGGLQALVADPAGQFLYAANSNSPARVVKIRLSDFTRNAGLTLNTSEDNAVDLTISSDGAYMLVATDNVPAGIVRINLATFTRAGSVFLHQPNEINLRSILLDAQNNYAFLGLNTDPGAYVTIEPDPKPLRLAMYREISPGQLGLTWSSTPLGLPTANTWLTVPTSSLFLDAGTYYLAWQCEADENVPSHTTGLAGDGFVITAPNGAFPATVTGYTTTASRWSGYVTFTEHAAATGWQNWN